MHTTNDYILADEQDSKRGRRYQLSDFRSFLFIYKYSKGQRKGLVFSLAVLFFASMIGVLGAYLTGELAGKYLINHDYSKIIQCISMILLAELVAIFAQWFGRYQLTFYSSNVLYQVRQGLLDYIQELPMGFYDRQPQGRIVTRITHDVENLEEFFTNSLGRIINAAFIGVSASLAMLISSPLIALAIIFSIIPSFIFISATRHYIRSLNRDMSRHSSVINSKLSEFISGIDVIRSLGLENWSQREYGTAVNNQLATMMTANRYYAITRPFVAFLCGMPLVILVLIGGYQHLYGILNIALFVAFVRYCEKFIGPVQVLAWEIHVIQKAFAAAERISAFLTHSTEDKIFAEDEGASVLQKNTGRISGKIQFENVDMSYDGKENVLHSVNFTISPGDVIGLVGRTGCGKTTTISLISRLYPFQSGNILVDDIPVQQYQRNFLRSQIGQIGQDVVIFKGSVRDNLDFGQIKSSKEILRAVEMTGLAAILKKNDMTLESEILEGGSNLSVGERQLLSITRILLKDPAILIMDEATANIDPYLESIIHQAVKKIMHGRTCLIIAHRLDTLRDCDTIFVFEAGRLVEQGKLNHLMLHGEKFGHLIKAGSEGSLMEDGKL